MKRALTLLEIMIVVLLITMITGVVGYNMRGALEKGKVFKTERAIEQLQDLLTLYLAEHRDKDGRALANQPELALEMAKNPKDLLQDGWGKKLDIQYKNNEFYVKSEKLQQYRKKHGLEKADTQVADEDEV